MFRSTSSTPTRRSLALVLAALCAAPMGAALANEKANNGTGGSWGLTTNNLGVQRLTTPGIDRDWVEVQDIKKMQAGEPVTRFAIAHMHKVAPTQFGTWDQPNATTKRWRMAIASPEANSINLGFTRFNLPEGAELTLLDKKGQAQFRSFTAADNDDHGQLWTPMVTGDELTLVLTVPADRAKAVELELGSINHGYRGLSEVPWFAKSGACNVDVVCPEGDDWREEIRSVAALTLNGVDQCSGALVNNARGDLTPYFLTAAHCSFGSASGAAGMVAYWNFENSTCRAPGSGASGGAGDGTRTQFNTGAIHRATRTATDFTLVEFDDPIDPAVNPFWAGIDARDQTTPSAVAIHHPSVDEKRISFENDPTTITTYLQNAIPGDGTHLRVTNWDLGTTEGGSSGSPLFSPDKHIIGQLHGGYASCTSATSDWYGRVALSWAAGGTAATQLKDWLDPDNTGTLVIDGRNEVEAPFDLALDPTAIEACGLEGTATVDIDVLQAEPGFTDDITLSVNNVPAGATSSLSDTVVTPPGSSVLTLSGLAGVATGNYTLQVSGTDGVDIVNKNLGLSLVADVPGAATLVSPANGGTASTTVSLAWNAIAGASSYQVELDDDADFSSPILDQVVTGTTAQVTGLDVETQYHWRVTATNGCGEGATSTVYTFTTGLEYCAAPAAAIPDNSATGVSSTITIPSGGSITDLQVGFEVTHTWIGDVSATLSNGTTSVVIFDRPGVPASQFGCSGDNADIILDDAATLIAETNCTTATPAYTPGEHYRPNNPLAGFDGASLAGTWTLTVRDNASGDTGSLVGWCLIPSTEAGGNTPPAGTTIPDAQASVGTAYTYDVGAYFSDADDDTLEFSATGLPAWASIDSVTGIISGTPAIGDVGSSSITVTATDPSDASASQDFTLEVVSGNAAPVAGTIEDVDVDVGVALVLDAGVAFSDPNGDDLVFSAPDLPAWATIDPVTGEITGTPTAADVGATVVTVIATEDTPDALTASTSFTLTVNGTPPGDVIFADGFEGEVIPD